MMANRDLKKAQEWALKSGYPFENDVFSIISSIFGTSVKIERNIEFEARNEEREMSIRSVDFLCRLKKDSKNIPHPNWRRGVEECIELNLVIDAKFSIDESLLFTPTIGEKKYSFPSLIPVLTKDSFREEVKICRRDFLEFSQLDGVPIAVGGRKVKEQSRERDSVASAVLQVCQGLAYFFKSEQSQIGGVAQSDSSYKRNAHFFFPVVVTNSPLLMLRPNIDVAKVDAAKSEDEIFEKLEMVALEMPQIPDLRIQWEELKNGLGRTANNLAWHNSGVGEGIVLFMTPQGLQQFLKNIGDKFSNLKVEP